jgi:hypothetical protein
MIKGNIVRATLLQALKFLIYALGGLIFGVVFLAVIPESRRTELWVAVTSLQFSDLMELAGTLFAAFLGAHFAFKKQNKKELDELKRSRVAAMQWAQFQISCQFDRMLDFQIHNLNNYRHHPARPYVLPAYPTYDYPDLKIDFKTLSFLIEIDSNFLVNLQLAETSFFNAIGNINIRSQFHLEEYQKAAPTESITNKLEVVEKAIGMRIAETLKTYTNEMYQSCDFAIIKLHRQGNIFFQLAKAIYPDQKFIRTDFPTDYIPPKVQ